MRLARPASIVTGIFFRLKSKPSIPPAKPVVYFEQLNKNLLHPKGRKRLLSWYHLNFPTKTGLIAITLHMRLHLLLLRPSGSKATFRKISREISQPWISSLSHFRLRTLFFIAFLSLNKNPHTCGGHLIKLVRMKGLEPSRHRHQILSLARLPIPPHPHN